MKKIFLLIPLLSIICLSSFAQLSWQNAKDVADRSYGNSRPRIVVDKQGNPLILWNHQSNVYFSRWNGTEFTTPVALNPAGVPIAGAGWMGPDIASKGDTVYAVYKETPETTSDKHVWCVSSFDGGKNFNEPVRVDDIADSLSRFCTVTIDNLGNPIVAFMKISPDFSHHEWVISKSTDLGNTFLDEVVASGWSDPESEACDCCTGFMDYNNGNLALFYRDNNNNIRDSWVGVSTNEGSSFNGGMNVDQLNWFINSCPSSGPHGFIEGDTIYTTFMSGGEGKSFVYYSKSSISNMSGGQAISVLDDNTGISFQNFPRIAKSNDNKMAIAWIQYKSPTKSVSFVLSDHISSPFTMPPFEVGIGSVDNVDLAFANGKVFIVWENNADGTIKFRQGNINNISTPDPEIRKTWVYPNPSLDGWNVIIDPKANVQSLNLYDIQGRLIKHVPKSELSNIFHYRLEHQSMEEGTYILEITEGNTVHQIKLLKTLTIGH